LTSKLLYAHCIYTDPYSASIMVAYKFLAIAFLSALTANAAPAGLLGEGGLVPLPPIDLPVTDIVEKVSNTFDGTTLEVVGETLNPDVRVGALDPETGAVDVGVDGAGLLDGVDVAVKTTGTKRLLDVDL
jgi:hypothetical protein